ncbi:tRNA (adenosine(37)-N6)-dimethylallyltransferase MiaA [Hansschlegelia quercus]|uniref:tRNA dimethylallyltransferase n=1 Tax=Hansschlegelia quercus TaxID=2528245 RepID=A0A4Q9GS18_9HYPH|nr:tRNA (adenosine(37)-N6)-dimethylallyltransferase MiaA [Hansschlegelia quercus]TBN54930.1 tRNA (adenosine(37)-N6)-dimethylallyltransferase MiaA [Hansschlegelia quercus]
MTEAPVGSVLIGGPTASGKSALAVALARALGGAVVNADASQVYADLAVLSARPSVEDETVAPHRLYGHVDGAEVYGVGRWLADATMVIKDLSGTAEPGPQERKAGRSTPIFVGGTGLYFEALTTGLATVPEVPADVRARWRSAPPAELHGALARLDPVMAARLRPSDPQRLTRALEVIDGTGRSLAEWQRETTPGPIPLARALRIVLSPDRAVLDGRIATRLERMMEQGGVDEAARLAARGLSPSLPVMKAIGVAHFAAFAQGGISRAEALERARLDTRRYAKRQSTWFRNRMADWIHVASEAALDVAMQEIERRGVG